jgi:hypothetical protein
LARLRFREMCWVWFAWLVPGPGLVRSGANLGAMRGLVIRATIWGCVQTVQF